MGFSGIIYNSQQGAPVRSLNGFYGIKIRIDVVSIKITDFRGRGLNNVKVEAVNPTSGVPFIGFTDSNGSVFMDPDSVTDIVITKNKIIKTVQYAGDVSPVYTIDLPYMEG